MRQWSSDNATVCGNGSTGGGEEEDRAEGEMGSNERATFSSIHSRAFTTLDAIRRIRQHRCGAVGDGKGGELSEENGGEPDIGTCADADSRAVVNSDAPANATGSFRSGDGTLRLLLIGADRNEGTSPLKTAAVFECLLRDGVGKTRGRSKAHMEAKQNYNGSGRKRLRVEEVIGGDIERIDILLVGPNIKLDDGVDEGVFHAVSAVDVTDVSSSQEETHVQIRVAYHVGMYHDMERRDDSDDPSLSSPLTSFVPDLAVAFNAGMWGYDPEDWRPTVERVLYNDSCPLVITAYTLQEAESDEDALSDMLSNQSGKPSVMWLWSAEINPFRSLKKRELQFEAERYLDKKMPDMLENCGWQCLLSACE